MSKKLNHFDRQRWMLLVRVVFYWSYKLRTSFSNRSSRWNRRTSLMNGIEREKYFSWFHYRWIDASIQEAQITKYTCRLFFLVNIQVFMINSSFKILYGFPLISAIFPNRKIWRMHIWSGVFKIWLRSAAVKVPTPMIFLYFDWWCSRLVFVSIQMRFCLFWFKKFSNVIRSEENRTTYVSKYLRKTKELLPNTARLISLLLSFSAHRPTYLYFNFSWFRWWFLLRKFGCSRKILVHCHLGVLPEEGWL